MISAKQRKILAFPYSRYDAIICDGAVRSGKTSIMSVAFVDWAMKNFAGHRFGICGKTVDSAVKNIVVPYLSMAYAQRRYRLKWRRSDKVLEVSRDGVSNFFEVFGGKDESSFALIQGRTLAGVLLDEVALMPESFVNQALARCSVDGARLWFSCNPANPRHWFYQEWISQPEKHNALYLRFAMTDNPSLSERTLERYRSMYSGVFFQRYVLGHWVAAEGLVYPMFDEDRHVVEDRGGGGRYFISVDYGTMNPTAAGLWRLTQQGAVMVREYYYDGRATKRPRTDEEHYQALEQLAAGVRVERVIVDPSAASFIECIRRHGRFDVWKADNAVLDGIRLTGSLLQAGKLLFDRSCVRTVEEFQAYVWDEDASEDAVVKEADHSMDQMRYFVNTVMRREMRG